MKHVERNALICVLYARGDVTQKQLGQRFNLTPQMISLIVLGIDSPPRPGTKVRPIISPEWAAAIRAEHAAGAAPKTLMRRHGLTVHYVLKTLGKIRPPPRKRRGPLLISSV